MIVSSSPVRLRQPRLSDPISEETRLLDNPPPVRVYAPGSWGPHYQLIAPHSWRLPFERQWREPDEFGA